MCCKMFGRSEGERSARRSNFWNEDAVETLLPCNDECSRVVPENIYSLINRGGNGRNSLFNHK